ncbi:DUF4157 domain-containing protein [Nostoc flagelliforme FACHB-838]|uniref:DUF4157 domain-containing protein n=2 Tax=Nostoc flagelliforme TaxID=1306274 RepID=A0ABR8DYF3_9NOSO|nr:DUF4157 domain-containing protein [Nostoc flagelliforme FACHB-838]
MKSLDSSTLQREALPEEEEEELQMKSLDSSTLQREALPEEEEELQMKPMVQRQAGMAATPDLETSINQARGGGQSLADNIRQPMEQAFGADFSGVKVHTDGQSDQLNRSIQARAFTTGQDVFFRQGEYNPGSRGGQELLAHELTHVVQQNGGAVQRSLIQRVMTQDELKSNVTVQGLKPKVNELKNHINLGTLKTLSLSKLQELKDAIDKSIKERGKLKSLGSDPGHIKRIEVEVNMQNELQGVIEQKQKQAQKDKIDSDNQKLKDAPSLLPSGSTWGKKK